MELAMDKAEHIYPTETIMKVNMSKAKDKAR